ncbi:MAG: N-acetylmuramoyl-L-alanine amidase [Chthoniobacteraceae bacterium]
MHRLRRLPVLLTWLLISFTAAAKTVVIDAGHGGHDRGGGPRQKIPEKPYALDVAQRLQRVLQAAGYKTVMTRSGDYFVSLGGRVVIANKYRDAVFVSIHFNSAPRVGADGIETYYYSSRSAKLASAIHSQVVATARTENRGVRKRGFYVIRNTKIPSVLCELGFLTNPAEGKKVSTSSAYRQALAEAVARGVMRAY